MNTTQRAVAAVLAALCISSTANLVAADAPAAVGMDAPPPYDALPSGCRYYPQRATRVLPMSAVISNDYRATAYYDPTAVKRDIVCFGRDITVDRLLRSNGGTILVVADHLTLNAPLDSRIYFWHGEKYWGDVPPGAPGWAVPLSAGMGYPNVQKALDAWSLYHEVYVPANKDYEWTVNSASTLEQRGDAFRAWQFHTVASPQLPFGMVTDEVERAANQGLRQPDAPAVPDREAIRSGDIILIVSRVDLCPSCGPVADGASDPTNGNIPVTYRAMLNASGVNGGRGAPGGVAEAATGFGTQYQGGITGKASRGGDAGNIEILGVADSANDLAQGRIEGVSRVIAGHGPYDGVRFVNLPVILNNLGVRSDRTFQPFSADPTYFRALGVTDKDALSPTLADLQGLSGTVSIRTGLTADQAIDAASSRISLLALHDFDVVAAGSALAAGDAEVGGFDPRDQLEHFLAAQIMDMESQLVETARGADGFGLSGTADGTLRRSLLLAPVRCSQLDHAALPDTTTVLVDRLCDFKDTGEPVLAAYWRRSGGLFASVPEGLADKLQQSRTNVQAGQSLSALNQIVDQLRDLNDTQYSQIERTSRIEMQNSLAALKAQADALSAELSKDPPSWQEQLGAVGALGEAAREAGVSGAAAYDSPSPATLAKAGQDLKSVYDRYEAWVNLSGNFDGLPEKHDQLKYQMASLSGSMKAFDATVSRRRAYTDAAQAVTLRNYIKANAGASRARDSVALLFTSMFRDQTQRALGFGGFASGKYGDGLTRIQNILLSFPDTQTVWPDGDLTNPCNGHNAAPLGRGSKRRVCVAIPINAHAGVLYSSTYPQLPLYVVPEIGQPSPVPVGPLGSSMLALGK